MTTDEVLLLCRAANQPVRIGSLLRWGDPDEVGAGEDTSGEGRRPPAHPLVQLADAYHAAITDLIERTTAIGERGTQPDSGEDRSDDPPR